MITETTNNLIIPVEYWLPITDKSVKGVKPYYFISDLGRVYNTNINRFVPQFDDGKRGYLLVTLATDNGNITKSVHRIVMIEFKGFDPDPDKDEVDHISGDKTINTIYNLEWVTGSENITRAFDMGLMASGEDSPLSKLSNDDVRQICLMMQNGYDRNIILDFLRSKGIKNEYGVFNSIYTRRSWKRISKDYVFANYDIRHIRFSDSEIHLICQCLEKRMPYKDIMIAIGIDIDNISQSEIDNLYQVISNIKRRSGFTHISNQYNFDENYSNKVFTDDEVHYICKRFEDGVSPRQILHELGYDIKVSKDRREYYHFMNPMNNIKSKKLYTNISSQYNF